MASANVTGVFIMRFIAQRQKMTGRQLKAVKQEKDKTKIRRLKVQTALNLSFGQTLSSYSAGHCVDLQG